MLTVGCSGFAVPATRYFKEYRFVEVQETLLAAPGAGTVRRWRREAPEGFRFALMGPREVGLEGFRTGTVVEAALSALREVAAELDADTAVFAAPADFGPSRANRAALRDLLALARGRFSQVVFEVPWDGDEADALAADTDTLAARDPLHAGLSRRERAYYRLPGPAGHRSRYEDPAIERLAELAEQAPGQEATYVFGNVDMFTDAQRFRRLVAG